MAVITENAKTIMIGTAWLQGYTFGGSFCGLLGTPSPLMSTSRLTSVYNSKAPINMLNTSRSFQKSFWLKYPTMMHHSSRILYITYTPLKISSMLYLILLPFLPCVWGINFNQKIFARRSPANTRTNQSFVLVNFYEINTYT